jgi:hypothetical protein
MYSPPIAYVIVAPHDPKNSPADKIDILRLLLDKVDFYDYGLPNTVFCSPYLSLLDSIISVEALDRTEFSPCKFIVSKWLLSGYCHEIKDQLDAKSLRELCESARDPYFIEFLCSLTDNVNHLYKEEHDFALIKCMLEWDDSCLIPNLLCLFRKAVSLHISSYWTITSIALEDPRQFRWKTITSVALGDPRQFMAWYTVLQEL